MVDQCPYLPVHTLQHQASPPRPVKKHQKCRPFFAAGLLSISLTAALATANQPSAEATPPASAAASANNRHTPTYTTFDQLTGQLEALGRNHPDSFRIHSIGKSIQNRDLWALTLAYRGTTHPDKRPAILIVAGLDGNHLVGSAAAVGVADQLLEKAADGDEAALRLLTDHTVYIVPRANPDGMEQAFNQVKMEYQHNLRPVDLDRDRRTDEDGPNDLNGDGFITLMRVYDPDKADQMADPADERLNIEPEAMKGESALFKVYREGIDDDGDGDYNEDPLGGVDLNKNFMHGYPEHQEGAGTYPLSEPESRALLKFVLEHQNIALAITYGRHDSLSNTPNGKGKYESGTPKNILEGDVSLYKVIGAEFRKITKLKKAPNPDWGGAFHSWAYAQFGIPSFATPLWAGPADAGKPKAEGNGNATAEADGADERLTPSGIGDISQETIDELFDAADRAGFEVTEEMKANITPQAVEQYAGMSGIKIRRIKAPEEAVSAEPATDVSEGADDKEIKPRNAAEAAWLKYSAEERHGEGFVNWTAFEHPTLGHVEIGGWVPNFKVNPPADETTAIAAKQVDFILHLADLFPQVALTEPKIKRLAAGLYEIEIALVNDGFLPTGTLMSVRNQRARPYVVRISTPVERIITGRRLHKIWRIEGSGGRYQIRWIIRAPDASKHTITVFSEKYGTFTREIRLSPNEDR